MAEEIFHTPTAFCEHCRYTIEQAVGSLPGIDRVAVDLARHTVLVSFDAGSIDADAIRPRIEGAGFPVVERGPEDPGRASRPYEEG